MKRKNFISILLICVIMLLSLASCKSGNSVNDTIVTDAITKEVEVDGVSKMQYKAQISNFTIYNINNISFQVELFKGDESVKVLEVFDDKSVKIDHNAAYLIEGYFDKGIDFDSIKVTNLEYDSLSFVDSYIAYIIAMPIAVIIFSAIIVATLLKNDNSKIDPKRPSVVGMLCLLLLIGMTNSLGWVVVVFLVSAAVLVFMAGYVTVMLQKKFPKQRSLIEMTKETEEALIDGEAIDAKVTELDSAEDADSHEDK